MFKRTVAVMALGWLAIGTTNAAAQTVNPRCNDDLIRGTYGFTIVGQKLGGLGPIGPQAGVAMTTFDGLGGLTQIDSVTVDGFKLSDFSSPQAKGTYSVNPDCTGTFTIQFQDGRPTVTANFVVSQNGEEIDTVVVAPPVLATRSIGKRRFADPQ